MAKKFLCTQEISVFYVYWFGFSVNLNRLLSSFMSQDKELDIILITSLRKYYDNLQYNTLVLIISTLALELDQFQPHFIVIIFI